MSELTREQLEQRLELMRHQIEDSTRKAAEEQIEVARSSFVKRVLTYGSVMLAAYGLGGWAAVGKRVNDALSGHAVAQLQEDAAGKLATIEGYRDRAARSKKAISRIESELRTQSYVKQMTLEGGEGSWYHNTEGQGVLFLGAKSDGQGQLAIVHPPDNSGPAASMHADADGGRARFFREGRLAAEIGYGRAGGVARFYDEHEGVVAQVGAKPDLGRGGGATFNDRVGNEVAFIGNWLGGGTVTVNGLLVHDYADVFELATRDGVKPGTVMTVAPGGTGLAPSVEAYDRAVVGVISGGGRLRSGMRIGTREDGTQDLPIAVSGQVYVRVCAEAGSIEPGDLLVTSSRRGFAMRATDPDRAFGAVVGKALESFSGEAEETEGLIRMLVMNR